MSGPLSPALVMLAAMAAAREIDFFAVRPLFVELAWPSPPPTESKQR